MECTIMSLKTIRNTTDLIACGTSLTFGELPGGQWSNRGLGKPLPRDAYPRYLRRTA